MQLGAELLLSLPTASVATTYPFSLDTTVARLTVAASMEQAQWSYGVNLGYQHYLSSTSGDDRDVLYGLFAGRGISDRLRGVLEYSSYTHSHEETGLDESLTDSAALVGVRYMVNDDLELGLAAGSGLGDAFADLKTVATLLWVPGRAAPARPVRPARALAPPRVPGADLLAGVRPGRGGVLIQISNRSGDGTLGEKVARILQRDGYVVPVVEQGSDRDWKSSYLFFRPAAVEQAARITELLRPARVNMVSYQLEGVDLLLVIGRDRAGL
ncbi:MAG: LytR C-terminal domain-containing protein [bacterium]|nr:MAG: LytR C-terminal domain-containing protein [bacterium]